MNKILASAFIVLLIGCGPKGLIVKKDFPDSIWKYSDDISYSFEDGALTGKQLNISIDYDEEYPFENIYLNVITSSDNDVKEQLVTIDLFNKIGVPLGNCGWGGCNINVPLFKSQISELAPDSKIVIQQYTRSSELKGLNSVSLILQ